MRSGRGRGLKEGGTIPPFSQKAYQHEDVEVLPWQTGITEILLRAQEVS